MSGCTVCAIVCLSVSDSNRSSSSVRSYVTIVLNLGLLVVLWVVVLAAGVSREELGSVVIVDDATVIIIDVVIKDAKYAAVVINVGASVVARVVGVVEVVGVGGVEFLG